MGFLSKLFGKQVNKATNLSAHYAVGATLTFDSSADFPSPDILALENDTPSPDWKKYYESTGTWPDGKRRVVCGVLDGIDEYFPFRDSSTRNIYIDSSANMMYRWKYFTKEQWDEAYSEQSGDPESKPAVFDVVKDENNHIIGYHGYVPCAGGGGGDLYWTDLNS